MNRISKGTAKLLLLALIVILHTNALSVEAAALKSEKHLTAKKNYYYDLDGDGKKEKIRYQYTNYNDDLDLRVTLYINDENVFSKYVKSSCDARYSIVDLDKNDKRLDLFLVTTFWSETLAYSAIQQYDNKSIKNRLTITSENNLFHYAGLVRIGGLSKINGKGEFSFTADTPIHFREIGSYLSYVPFTTKNNVIQYKKTSTYELLPYSKKYTYEPARPINVYEKADKNSDLIMTLSETDEINVKKLKIGKRFEDKSTGDRYYDGYAYVVVNGKLKGWIYLSNDSSDSYDSMFKEKPGWG